MPDSSKLTLGVVISVPSPWREQLISWRAHVGDPAAAQVFPHVTLLPPTEVDADAMPEILDHLAAAADAFPGFDMHLAGTGTFRPVSDVVFVVVAAGIAQCEQLEARVRSGPLAQPARRFPYHPHVTVAHDIAQEDLDRAYDGLAGFEARFPVSGFTVFEQVAGGVWETRKDFTLRGS